MDALFPHLPPDEDDCSRADPAAAGLLSAALVEKLAALHHRVYCREVAGAPSVPDFQMLSPEEQEQNRAAVRDIPHKLGRIGCTIERAPHGGLLFELSEPEVERLARLEHQRWLRAQREAGWRHGSPTGESRRVHAAMVPWEDLLEAEKEKDRILVRSIPRILRLAGLAVVRFGRSREGGDREPGP